MSTLKLSSGKGRAVLALVIVLMLGALVSIVRDGGGGGSDLSGFAGGYNLTEVGADSGAMMTGGDGDFAGAGAGAGASASASSGGGGGAGGPAGAAAKGRSVPADPTSRIIRTARVRVKIGEGGLDGIEDRVTAAAEAAGGFVHTSDRRDDSLSLTLRVPADDFDAVLGDIRRMGTVKEQSVRGRDVTEEYVDIEARLRHWRAQEGVYLRLLSTAGTIGESLEVQKELSRVQETIEQLEGRRRYLDDRTELSTITAAFFTPAAATRNSESQGRLSKAWTDAKDAAFDVVGGTIVVMGALVPLAIIAGVPALGVWMVLRRRRPLATP